MPKFFVFSDIHGFFDIFHNSLIEAGYDENNPDHYLIGCGDYFDRGKQPYEVFTFLKNRPRTILIKGNHEDLFEHLVDRGWPKDYDMSNGTYQTIKDFTKTIRKYKKVSHTEDTAYGRWMEDCKRTADYILPFIGNMLNYFETSHYIFVHGWIPCNKYVTSKTDENQAQYDYFQNWREANEEDWYLARWRNGFDMARNGIIVDDKTIVCGHWHSSYAYHMVDGTPEWGPEANFSVYQEKHIACIDACTAYSKQVNILVLEDNFLKEEKEVSVNE